MTRLLILVSKLTFLDFAIFGLYISLHFCQKWVLENSFPTKCQGQNDRMGRTVMSCVCQNLDFIIGFAMKTSIFKRPPPLRFICLISLFYGGYVSSMYNRSNRSNVSNISNILTRFNRSNSIEPIYTSTNGVGGSRHNGCNQIIQTSA